MAGMQSLIYEQFRLFRGCDGYGLRESRKLTITEVDLPYANDNGF